MKKINKIIVGVIGLALFAGKGQSTSAAVSTTTQRYGTVVASPTPTTVTTYRDSNLMYTPLTNGQLVNPTVTPTPKPTVKPTLTPTPKPTAKPTPKPTAKPTAKPTPKPTAKPTTKPTPKPTSKPGQGATGVIDNIQVEISNFFKSLFGK